jgi:5-methyltetrahydrofolate--homocysteine methyltransferase
MAPAISALGVDVLGINCGRSLEDNLKALKELCEVSSLPIWFKPNAGLPRLDDEDRPFYDVTPEMMAAHVSEWLAGGARIVGGCCGTSPEHLRQIAQAVKA